MCIVRTQDYEYFDTEPVVIIPQQHPDTVDNVRLPKEHSDTLAVVSGDAVCGRGVAIDPGCSSRYRRWVACLLPGSQESPCHGEARLRSRLEPVMPKDKIDKS